MELINGIKGRRSIRKFKETPVAHDVIEEIIEAASYAPSWKNTQIARYIIVEDAAIKEALTTNACTYNFAFNAKTISRAPQVAIICYETGISGFDPDGSFSTKKEDGFEMFDAGLATEAFCLAAYEKGVGTVILGYFDEDEIRKVVDLPASQKIACLVPMGYPDTDPTAPERKTVAELLTFK